MIHFFTKNIDEKKYRDIIQRIVMINGNDGEGGYQAWKNFEKNWQLNIIRRELLSFNFNSFYNYNSSIEIDEMCISKDINKVDYSCAIEEYLINKYEKEFLRKIHLKNTRQLKIYLSKQNFKLYKRLIKHV